MATVTIGQMDKRITLRQPTKTDDTSGGKTAAYADWFTTQAQVIKMNTKRALDYGFDAVNETFDVYIYWRSSMSALTKDTRITWEGKDFGLTPGERLDSNKNIYHFTMTAET